MPMPLPTPDAARRFAMIAGAALALAATACAPARQTAPADPAPPSMSSPAPVGHMPDDGSTRAQCDAAAAGRFVGRVLDATIEREARDAANARSVRVIRPGMAVTMDYREDRLNIEVDDANRITRIHCG